MLARTAAAFAAAAGAQDVKSAPRGSHARERCDRGRAAILEDRTGASGRASAFEGAATCVAGC